MMLYVLNCHKKFGHHGIYPAPVARWLARRLTERTGRQFDVFTRREYRREKEYWSRVFPRY